MEYLYGDKTHAMYDVWREVFCKCDIMDSINLKLACKKLYEEFSLMHRDYIVENNQDIFHKLEEMRKQRKHISRYSIINNLVDRYFVKKIVINTYKKFMKSFMGKQIVIVDAQRLQANWKGRQIEVNINSVNFNLGVFLLIIIQLAIGCDMSIYLRFYEKNNKIYTTHPFGENLIDEHCVIPMFRIVKQRLLSFVKMTCVPLCCSLYYLCFRAPNKIV